MIWLQRRKGQKIIVIGLTILVCLAMIYLYNSLNLSNYTFNEELNLKKQKLVKYRQKILEKKVVEKELLSRQNIFKQAEATLLNGKTPSLAAAEIQEIVTGITKAADAEIMTIRILQPDRSGKDMYLAIPVEVTITSTIRELTQLLYKLDNSPKLLRIAKLRIKSRRGRSGRRGTRESSVIIVSTLTVEGFVKRVEA